MTCWRTNTILFLCIQFQLSILLKFPSSNQFIYKISIFNILKSKSRSKILTLFPLRKFVQLFFNFGERRTESNTPDSIIYKLSENQEYLGEWGEGEVAITENRKVLGFFGIRLRRIGAIFVS